MFLYEEEKKKNRKLNREIKGWKYLVVTRLEKIKKINKTEFIKKLNLIYRGDRKTLDECIKEIEELK